MATKEPPQLSIGERIVFHREQMGISQLRLAHLIGWKGMDAGAQISRIETGKTEPRVSTLILIARELKVTLKDLLPDA